MEVDGLTREWYEYVPECCTSDKKWPLVVVMHGRGGTAETFFDISNMYQVANRRKFIVACPQASVYQQKQGGLRNVALWEGFLDGEAIDDVKFIRSMIADMEARLSVDHGRIYACGQSSGGMMADTLCEFAGDLFCRHRILVGALHTGEGLYDQRESGERAADHVYFRGQRQSGLRTGENAGGFRSPSQRNLRRLWRTNFCATGWTSPRCRSGRDYPITWYSYPNADGVPMFTVGIVDHMGSCQLPGGELDQLRSVLQQFSRDEDGGLYYRGTAVKR